MATGQKEDVTKMIDVLVVGAGPVGLTAALEAKRLGLSVRIIDIKDARSNVGSRALSVHPRVLELMEPIGKIDEPIGDNKTGLKSYSAVEKLMKRSIRGTHFHVHFDCTKEKSDVVSASFEGARWGDTEYPFEGILPQCDTERTLEETLETAYGCHVDYGVSIDDIMQTEDCVTATLVQQGPAQGKEVVDCQYLIGCDGARSRTRDLIGVELTREKSDSYFVIADLTFEDISQLDGATHFMAFPSEHGACFFFPLVETQRFRVFLQAAENVKSADDISIDKAFVEEVLLQRTGLSLEVASVDWQSVLRIAHGVSDTFRRDRVFLAGDASHVHSPVGGQGMNYGLQDVCNLLWKLAWAKRCLDRYPLAKESVEIILESYNSERHAMGEVLIGTVKPATYALVTRNSYVQALRNAFIRYTVKNYFQDGVRFLGQLDLQYDPNSSKIIMNPLSQQSWVLEKLSSYWKTPQFICEPGQRLPNLVLSDGTKLYKHVSRVNHTFLFLNLDCPPNAENFTTLRANPALPSDQTTMPPIDEAILMKPQVVLIRPDLFVAGIEDSFTVLVGRLSDILDESALTCM